MTPKEVLALCREKDVKAINMRYCDLWGTWHQTTVPTQNLNEELFSEGLGLDTCGSAGDQIDQMVDLMLLPQQETVFIDPFAELNTLNIICQIMDPISLDSFSLDPRFVASKAQNHLQQTGIADEALFGPQPEFYAFDRADFDQTTRSGYFSLDVNESSSDRCRTAWPAPLAIRHDQAVDLSTAGPGNSAERFTDLRNEIMQSLLECGVGVNWQRQAIGAGRQIAIDLRQKDLVSISDDLMTCKYVARSVACKHNKTVTFMPKPIFGASGSGMPISFSLWKEKNPEFAGSEFGGLSEKALYAIGGIQQHSGALAAFTNPTTNSYKRLLGEPGGPFQLGYSKQNRLAACRIPMLGANPNSKQIEIRFPDPSCNPYLAFSAILMAAIDGIQNKIEPGEPLDASADNLASSNTGAPKQISRSLSQSLRDLEKDCAFLLKGEVFTEDLIATWIEHKFKVEVDPLNAHPSPYEFCLYYDV